MQRHTEIQDGIFIDNSLLMSLSDILGILDPRVGTSSIILCKSSAAVASSLTSQMIIIVQIAVDDDDVARIRTESAPASVHVIAWSTGAICVSNSHLHSAIIILRGRVRTTIVTRCHHQWPLSIRIGWQHFMWKITKSTESTDLFCIKQVHCRDYCRPYAYRIHFPPNNRHFIQFSPLLYSP